MTVMQKMVYAGLMTEKTITRRQFNGLLLGSAIAGGTSLYSPLSSTASNDLVAAGIKPVKVAALQMTAKLADVNHNMQQAEHLIQQALEQGAKWIILPEMFTTAVAFHPNMLTAIQSLDGPALQMLKDYAHKGNAIIGGSFLAQRHDVVYNTFVLVFPDGKILSHDKDLPTYWENCFYRGGSDDGILDSPAGPVGVALCWEMIRSQTPKRLRDRVGLVLAGSCWWTLPDDAPADSPRWKSNLKMLKEAAPRLARMLGVPVIHGSHAGDFEGFFSPELPDVAFNSMYLGETMIVDNTGKVLASRSRDKGEGVVTAEITIDYKPAPSEAIPGKYWIPDEMPDDWKASFDRWLETGADYYAMVTRPYLETGIINEYEPPYMR